MRAHKRRGVYPGRTDGNGGARARGLRAEIVLVLCDQMKPQICICCGEPIAETGHELSRNPNVCASCSSMADGMEESSLETLSPAADDPRSPDPTQAQTSTALPPPKPAVQAEEEIVLDWSAGQLSKSTLILPK